MSYLAEFRGWEPLTLADLLMAYHKGKADCYFENTFRVPAKESFERDLAYLRCGKNDFYVMGRILKSLGLFKVEQSVGLKLATLRTNARRIRDFYNKKAFAAKIYWQFGKVTVLLNSSIFSIRNH